MQNRQFGVPSLGGRKMSKLSCWTWGANAAFFQHPALCCIQSLRSGWGYNAQTVFGSMESVLTQTMIMCLFTPKQWSCASSPALLLLKRCIVFWPQVVIIQLHRGPRCEVPRVLGCRWGSHCLSGGPTWLRRLLRANRGTGSRPTLWRRWRHPTSRSGLWRWRKKHFLARVARPRSRLGRHIWWGCHGDVRVRPRLRRHIWCGWHGSARLKSRLRRHIWWGWHGWRQKRKQQQLSASQCHHRDDLPNSVLNHWQLNCATPSWAAEGSLLTTSQLSFDFGPFAVGKVTSYKLLQQISPTESEWWRASPSECHRVALAQKKTCPNQPPNPQVPEPEQSWESARPVALVFLAKQHRGLFEKEEAKALAPCSHPPLLKGDSCNILKQCDDNRGHTRRPPFIQQPLTSEAASSPEFHISFWQPALSREPAVSSSQWPNHPTTLASDQELRPVTSHPRPRELPLCGFGSSLSCVRLWFEIVDIAAYYVQFEPPTIWMALCTSTLQETAVVIRKDTTCCNGVVLAGVPVGPIWQTMKWLLQSRRSLNKCVLLMWGKGLAIRVYPHMFSRALLWRWLRVTLDSGETISNIGVILFAMLQHLFGEGRPSWLSPPAPCFWRCVSVRSTQTRWSFGSCYPVVVREIYRSSGFWLIGTLGSWVCVCSMWATPLRVFFS